MSLYNNSRFPAGPIGRQRGAVLFVGLMLLIIIALIAITASGTSILEERMTGGFRNRQLATMGSETALRAGEARLWQAGPGNAPIPTCSTQIIRASVLSPTYCYIPTSVNPLVQTFRTSDAASNYASASAGGFAYNPANATYNGTDLTNLPSDPTAQLAATPWFLMEDLGIDLPPGVGGKHESGVSGAEGAGTGKPKHLFRITARSVGGNNAVVRVVESTFSSKPN